LIIPSDLKPLPNVQNHKCFGGGIDVSVIMPPPAFDPWRFFVTTAMAVTVSVALSYLWTLDDLRIRLYNRKTKEVRMIGKYLGLILPVVLGFYGMISLSKNHSMMIAIQYLLQMIFILYSPFLVFNVLHAFYRECALLSTISARTGRRSEPKGRMKIIIIAIYNLHSRINVTRLVR
jgi:hypothetical protein